MKIFMSAILTVLLAGGCSPAADADAAPPADAPPSNAAIAEDRISDAEIAAIVVAANEIDADLGELAASRASDPEVQEFGRAMTGDHRAVNEQAGALVTRLGVTPVENDVSRKLRSDAQAFRTELESKTGSDFDRSYIEHEIAYHQAVIDALDGLLIPGATNAELKQTLEGVRPSLVAHRQYAEQLHAKMR